MYANVDVHVCMFISLSISKSFLNFSRAKFILVFFFCLCLCLLFMFDFLFLCFLKFACMNTCSVDVLLMHFVIENVRVCRYFCGCLS